METLVLEPVPGSEIKESDLDLLLKSEWLVTNGLGGYAAGTLSGILTRRYHALLVAALPAPFGRVLMLTKLAEEVRLPGGRTVVISGQEHPGHPLELDWVGHLADFRLESGLPVWQYQVEGFRLEKRLIMPYRQNTVHITYRLLEGKGELRLRLRPAVHFRHHEDPVSEPLKSPYVVKIVGDRLELSSSERPPDLHKEPISQPLRMVLKGNQGAFVMDGGGFEEICYRLELSRGYEHRGRIWSPGYYRTNLRPGESVTLVAATESWDIVLALDPQEAQQAESERRRRLVLEADRKVQDGLAAQLILAADQFLIAPNTRLADAARARAAGDEVRTIIAGYHWFTDWGRDTMISLEGLTLTTGRHNEAGYILRTFAHYIKDGLIPNLFPEGGREGLYHTADATLWFFHALQRYVQSAKERSTLRILLPHLLDIIDHHRRGTRFGIRVDPGDGLLVQGEQGFQLTWMDAKVDDWVVTPRRGKAVEINALWYNALRLLENWLVEEGQSPDSLGLIRRLADQAYESFNRRFWYEEGGYLYDVLDGEPGNDPALRPNQIFAISLDHPVLDRQRWQQVMDVVGQRLLTPVGLRSLASGHPEYRASYDGDLRARDAAYHQGTVWPWLIGPYIDAWLKLHPQRLAEARQILLPLLEHLKDAGVGSISEIFDAEEPFHPRGCVAQAWSVAEALRCWVKTSTD
jgi:predicted glycogen debranching enzyme